MMKLVFGLLCMMSFSAVSLAELGGGIRLGSCEGELLPPVGNFEQMDCTKYPGKLILLCKQVEKTTFGDMKFSIPVPDRRAAETPCEVGPARYPTKYVRDSAINPGQWVWRSECSQHRVVMSNIAGSPLFPCAPDMVANLKVSDPSKVCSKVTKEVIIEKRKHCPFPHNRPTPTPLPKK